MTRHVAVAAFIAALTLVGCQKSDSPKSLGERIYDKMVQRCKLLAPKGEESRCTSPSGATYREATHAVPSVMVDQITKLLPADGSCSMHGGSYLICTEKLMGGDVTRTIYRLDPARDGSDSQVIYVWSRDW